MANARRVGIAALLLGGSQLLSRALGIVREMVLAAEIGAGAATDAYQAAFQIPDILNHILAVGAISIAFIPLYRQAVEREGAEAAHRLAEQYDVLVALNTDHCPPDKADSFLRPLIAATAERRARGETNLFQNHMLDASNLPLEENLALSKEYLALCAENEIVLEVEAGIVGGEEDGAHGTVDMPADKLYTTPEDMVAVYEALHPIGPFTFAATFGNVHGHYKPGAVKLRPEILKEGQSAVTEKYGAEAEMDLVFHGGSGSLLEEIRETLGYGVIKMNVDTDAQYTFTRPIVDHMMTNYEAVLKVDGEIGNKKLYDPRSYLKKAEESMAARVGVACSDLLSEGKTLFGQI